MFEKRCYLTSEIFFWKRPSERKTVEKSYSLRRENDGMNNTLVFSLWFSCVFILFISSVPEECVRTDSLVSNSQGIFFTEQVALFHLCFWQNWPVPACQHYTKLTKCQLNLLPNVPSQQCRICLSSFLFENYDLVFTLRFRVLLQCGFFDWVLNDHVGKYFLLGMENKG